MSFFTRERDLVEFSNSLNKPGETPLVGVSCVLNNPGNLWSAQSLSKEVKQFVFIGVALNLILNTLMGCFFMGEGNKRAFFLANETRLVFAKLTSFSGEITEIAEIPRSRIQGITIEQDVDRTQHIRMTETNGVELRIQINPSGFNQDRRQRRDSLLAQLRTYPIALASRR